MEVKSYVESYIHTSEPVLFETQAPMTEKNYEDFQKFSYTKRNTGAFTFNLVTSVIAAVLGLLFIIVGYYVIGILNIAIAAFAVLMPFMSLKKNSSAVINQSAFHAGNVNNYKFYQDCFLNTDFYTVSAIPYNVVFEAHETEEYFFIYISKVQAHIIPKESFVFNTPQEMRKLLSMKLGNKFIIHCK